MNSLTRAENDSELITTWLLHQSSKLTRQHYQSNIKQFIRFIGLSLEEVKIEDINGFVRMLELKGNKPSTIKGKLSTVKSLFSFAYKDGKLLPEWKGEPILLQLYNTLNQKTPQK